MNTSRSVVRLVKKALLVVPLGLAPAISDMIAQSAGFGNFVVSAAFAQDEKPARKQYKTKQVYSLRQSVFKDFAGVQEKIDADDWPGVLQVLKDIERKKAPDYTSFERASLWNYFGYAYYSLEDYPTAISYYEKVLTEEQLSEALQLGALYTSAQLMFVQENYAGAVKNLEEWMSLQEIVGADAYVLIAQGYFQLNEIEKARESVDYAVDKYEALEDQNPKENWYALQRAIYYELGNNEKVLEILTKLIRYYPKPTYWKQMASIFGVLEQERNQLHTMETVYLMGELKGEKELLNLAYLFLGAEVPWKSASIIKKGMSDGIIEETSKNLEVLATALRLAQHTKESIPVMAKAAEKSDKGELYARLAAVYLDSDQFDKSLEAGNKAVKRGGVKRTDQLQIVMGMAHVSRGDYDKAIRAFREAGKDKRSENFAKQWIDFARAEKKRVSSLRI